MNGLWNLGNEVGNVWIFTTKKTPFQMCQTSVGIMKRSYDLKKPLTHRIKERYNTFRANLLLKV